MKLEELAAELHTEMMVRVRVVAREIALKTWGPGMSQEEQREIYERMTPQNDALLRSQFGERYDAWRARQEELGARRYRRDLWQED